VAANRAEVLVHGRRARVVGSICMDQFVVDLGLVDDVAVGDEAVLIGTGEAGEPTAQDWAEWTGTIAYEVVTRLGGRIVRRYTGVRS
jgi:alanine racemase